MGTRSLTICFDREKPVVCLYAQWDGYPSSHGAALLAFLEPFDVIHGIGVPPPEGRKQANGVDCLAAQLVAHFKGDTVGGFYLIPPPRKGLRVGTHAGEEYVYTVSVDDDRTIRVSVGEGTRGDMFNGTVDEYRQWLASIDA